MSFNTVGRLGLIVLFAWSLAACGNTWGGLKEDTGENMEAVGESMNSTGEDMQKSGEEEQEVK